MKSLSSSTNLYALVSIWVEALSTEEGHAKATILAYHFYLSRFRDYIGNVPVSQITLEDINTYRTYLATLTISPATQNYHMIALKQFFKYFGERGLRVVPYTMIKIPKFTRPEVVWLTDDEVVALLESPDTSTIRGLRDRAILELFASSGLRVSELVSLNRDSINISDRQFYVRGKGSKTRPCFIGEAAAMWLQQYLLKRTDSSKAMFVQHGLTTDEERLSVRGIQRLIKKHVAAAGITKDVTPHTLRHSFATALRRRGADTADVQKLLGHASITTTMIYNHYADADLKEIHKHYGDRKQEGDML